MNFIDDQKRLFWLYLMHEKSDVKKLFQIVYRMIENQFQIKINIFHSDNGTEFLNKC